MNHRTDTSNSRQLRARAARVLPGGVNSNVRLLAPPIFFARGAGARLVDVDGNEYIDYLLGQGPNFLGHAPKSILEAVATAVQGGMVYGTQHPLEVEAAEAMVEMLGWPDQVRLGLSGTESVQAALRLARAVTGRSRFIRFEGHYHGWLDNVLVKMDGNQAAIASAGQLASHLEESVTLPWNNPVVVEDALEANDDIAAVLMEPVMLNAGSIEPEPGYLERVQAACTRHGVVLIFDEVISGFRVAPGGAAELYGITPDLAVYGKAMAGGWPVSALAGRKEMMERFGTGEVNHSGTFNASVMACAAIVSTLAQLSEDPPYQRVTDLGRRLMGGLSRLADQHGLDLHLQGLPMAFHASFGDGPAIDYRTLSAFDTERYAAFTEILIQHGVWVAGRGIWYLSTAHDDADIDETLDRVDAAMKEFRA